MWSSGNTISPSAPDNGRAPGFATGLVAILWLYWSWLIFLTGARLAFYIQHPRYLGTGRAFRPGDRERLRLEAAYWLAWNRQQGGRAMGVDELARRLGRGPDEVDRLLADMAGLGVVRAEKGRPARYRLARDPAAIPLSSLFPGAEHAPGPDGVRTWLQRLAEGRRQALGKATVADLMGA